MDAPWRSESVSRKSRRKQSDSHDAFLSLDAKADFVTPDEECRA